MEQDAQKEHLALLFFSPQNTCVQQCGGSQPLCCSELLISVFAHRSHHAVCLVECEDTARNIFKSGLFISEAQNSVCSLASGMKLAQSISSSLPSWSISIKLLSPRNPFDHLRCVFLHRFFLLWRHKVKKLKGELGQGTLWTVCQCKLGLELK